MKRISLILVSAVLFFSCININGITGSGNIVTEKRNAEHFNGIKVSGSIDIEVRNGNVSFAEVEADDNIQSYIITEVKDGIFTARFKSNTSFTNTHAKVYVTALSLQKISVSGSGTVTSVDTIKNNSTVEFNISGSGDIKVYTDAPSIKAHIGGSGNIVLKGRTKNFDGTIQGSGDLKCHDLLAENAIVEIMGSGTAHVFSSVSINAKTRGSGDIFYSGNPASTQIDKKGSGDVKVE